MMRSKLFILAGFTTVSAICGCQSNSERIEQSHWSNGQIKEEWTEIKSESELWTKQGKFSAFYQSGNIREAGEFRLGKRVGAWEFWYDMEERFPLMRGNYEGGEMDGAWEFWMDPMMEHGSNTIHNNDSNESITSHKHLVDSSANKHHRKPHKQESYLEGKPHGLWISWHSESQVADSAFYSNGKLEGKAVSYYPNGKPSYEANYKAGQLVGKIRIWDETGTIIQ